MSRDNFHFINWWCIKSRVSQFHGWKSNKILDHYLNRVIWWLSEDPKGWPSEKKMAFASNIGKYSNLFHCTKLWRHFDRPEITPNHRFARSGIYSQPAKLYFLSLVFLNMLFYKVENLTIDRKFIVFVRIGPSESAKFHVMSRVFAFSLF